MEPTSFFMQSSSLATASVTAAAFATSPFATAVVHDCRRNKIVLLVRPALTSAGCFAAGRIGALWHPAVGGRHIRHLCHGLRAFSWQDRCTHWLVSSCSPWWGVNRRGGITRGIAGSKYLLRYLNMRALRSCIRVRSGVGEEERKNSRALHSADGELVHLLTAHPQSRGFVVQWNTKCKTHAPATEARHVCTQPGSVCRRIHLPLRPVTAVAVHAS